MCLIIFCALCVVMIASQPLATTERSQEQLQKELLYQQWPGVADERLADAELDNAYELYKSQTSRKPRLYLDSLNSIELEKLSTKYKARK